MWLRHRCIFFTRVAMSANKLQDQLRLLWVNGLLATSVRPHTNVNKEISNFTTQWLYGVPRELKLGLLNDLGCKRSMPLRTKWSVLRPLTTVRLWKRWTWILTINVILKASKSTIPTIMTSFSNNLKSSVSDNKLATCSLEIWIGQKNAVRKSVLDLR